MRHVSTRKIPIKFFMIEGTTQTRIDIMNLPEHSKKSCTGKIIQKNPMIFLTVYFGRNFDNKIFRVGFGRTTKIGESTVKILFQQLRAL